MPREKRYFYIADFNLPNENSISNYKIGVTSASSWNTRLCLVGRSTNGWGEFSILGKFFAHRSDKELQKQLTRLHEHYRESFVETLRERCILFKDVGSEESATFFESLFILLIHDLGDSANINFAEGACKNIIHRRVIDAVRCQATKFTLSNLIAFLTTSNDVSSVEDIHMVMILVAHPRYDELRHLYRSLVKPSQVSSRGGIGQNRPIFLAVGREIWPSSTDDAIINRMYNHFSLSFQQEEPKMKSSSIRNIQYSDVLTDADKNQVLLALKAGKLVPLSDTTSGLLVGAWRTIIFTGKNDFFKSSFLEEHRDHIWVNSATDPNNNTYHCMTHHTIDRACFENNNVPSMGGLGLKDYDSMRISLGLAEANIACMDMHDMLISWRIKNKPIPTSFLSRRKTAASIILKPLRFDSCKDLSQAIYNVKEKQVLFGTKLAEKAVLNQKSTICISSGFSSPFWKAIISCSKKDGIAPAFGMIPEFCKQYQDISLEDAQKEFSTHLVE